MYMKNKIAIIATYLVTILLIGYLIWNTVPKKITVGEITYETMFCSRQSAFKKTKTLMHPKDKNVEKTLESMWKEGWNEEEYKLFVSKVVGGISEQLGPGYEVIARWDNLTTIYVINLKKQVEEDEKVARTMESIKNL